MKRRAALIAAAGVAAAAAGAAWWRWRPGAPEPAPQGFWSLRFERPEGGELALGALRGRPVLLNFWATWCPPCITELPLLSGFQRERDRLGWQVVGLAVDAPTPVRSFLARRPVDFPVGLAGLDGIELTRSLGNASGALPFSVVFDRAGDVVARKLGTLGHGDLEAWVALAR
jgi:thiol-disulfide isomerase/thioredoxin